MWFRRDSRFDELWAALKALEAALHSLAKRVDGTAPAVLRADLDDLRAACEVDRISHRKALGKLWGRIGRDERESPNGPSAEVSSVGNDELQAYLDLQNAHTRT